MALAFVARETPACLPLSTTDSPPNLYLLALRLYELVNWIAEQQEGVETMYRLPI